MCHMHFPRAETLGYREIRASITNSVWVFKVILYREKEMKQNRIDTLVQLCGHQGAAILSKASILSFSFFGTSLLPRKIFPCSPDTCCG